MRYGSFLSREVRPAFSSSQPQIYMCKILSCTISSESLALLFLWSLVSPESDILPKKRPKLTEVPEDEESPSPSSLSVLSSPSSRSGAKQRNRRRCHFCRTRLELVQHEMGSCRCGTLMQLYANINTYREILTHAHILSRNRSSPLIKSLPLHIWMCSWMHQ